MLFVVMGSWLYFVIPTIDVNETLSDYRGLGSSALALIRLFFGQWPPAIALWGIGTVYLLRAGRERLSEQAPPSRPQGHRTGATVTGRQLATPIVHRCLGIALLAFAHIGDGLRQWGIAPTGRVDVHPLILYGPSGAAVALMAVAFVAFRPRVPNRSPRQTTEEFWSSPDVDANVFLMWALLESAGLIATVGYVVTGDTTAVVTMGLTMVMFWTWGPEMFEAV